MKQKHLTLGAKAVLPLVFFSYAAIANLSFFQGDLPAIETEAFAQGWVTSQIDTLYREALPHREPSVSFIGAARYALLGEGRKGVVVGTNRDWLFTNEETRQQSEADSPMQAAALHMAEVARTLEMQGITLVVVPLPTKVDIARNQFGNDDLAEYAHENYTMFLQALGGVGVTTVNTRPAFEAAGHSQFFATDTHWTSNMAGEVAVLVAASDPSMVGDTLFTKRDLQPEAFTGDLVSFITSDDLAPLVGLTPEVVVPFLAEADIADDGGNLDLFGDSSQFDAVLIGTSYSANPRWSFVESLKVALHRDVLNLAREGQGPVKPMRDFLQGDLPAMDAPPTFVIWEFPVRYLTDPTLWDHPSEKEGDHA